MSDDPLEIALVQINDDGEIPKTMPGFWGVAEIMGHRRHAGLISVIDLAGIKMLRIDVPGPVPGSFCETRQYAGSALFGVHPSTEAAVREECERAVWRQQESPQRRLVFTCSDEDDEYDSPIDYQEEDEN